MFEPLFAAFADNTLFKEEYSMNVRRKGSLITAILVILSMLLAACGAPAAAPAGGDDAAAEEASAETAASSEESAEITRAETVFIDESARMNDPTLWNP